MDYPSSVFSPDEERTIINAIQRFELLTSGELRVHVEHLLRRPPVDEAARVFEALRMHHTAERNGVLILLAPQQRSFAICGDVGIDEVTPANFWDSTCETMRPYFADGRFVDGLVAGIEIAGHALAEHFPRRAGDINELPDDISYG